MQPATAKKKKLHLRLSRRLLREVRQTVRWEGRGPSSQVEFDLEVILPVVQAEKRYRLVPKTFDFGSPACDLTTQLDPEYYEVLEDAARSSGLSVNQQVCELLWYVAERRMQFCPQHTALKKEEFRKRVLEHVRARFARIQ